MANTLKLTATPDGQIKVRVVNPSERDQSAIVSFDDLQEMIRLTQTGDEAELELEEEDDPGAVASQEDPAPPVDTGPPPDAGAADATPPDQAEAGEVDLSQPVEGEPVIDQEPSAEPEDNEAEVDDGASERQGPGM
jgi:hypothetical protein